jgi:hypothetical protein
MLTYAGEALQRPRRLRCNQQVPVRRRCAHALLVHAYLLTGTKVQILTPEDLLQATAARYVQTSVQVPTLLAFLVQKYKSADT